MQQRIACAAAVEAVRARSNCDVAELINDIFRNMIFSSSLMCQIDDPLNFILIFMSKDFTHSVRFATSETNNLLVL